MLQQIANRVQRDCVNGEDKLALARTALQSVRFVSYDKIVYSSFSVLMFAFSYPLTRMLNVWSLVFSS